MRPRPGPIGQHLAADHARLDALLDEAARAGGVARAPYEAFRAGLLRHIGLEEKILLPAARRARGGQPLALAAQLRHDHAALAALLVPTPTPEILQTLRELLDVHNPLEEGPEGLYAIGDALLHAEADAVLARLRAFPRNREE